MILSKQSEQHPFPDFHSAFGAEFLTAETMNASIPIDLRFTVFH
jgi:hypothetical protein